MCELQELSLVSPRKEWQRQNEAAGPARGNVGPASALPATSINSSCKYNMSSGLSLVWENALDMVETSTEKQQIKHVQHSCDKPGSLRNASNCLEITACYLSCLKKPLKVKENSKEGIGAMLGDLRSNLHVINYEEWTIHQHLQTKADLCCLPN